MQREPDVGFDPGSPGSRPGPKASAKPLRHPGIPRAPFLMVLLSTMELVIVVMCKCDPRTLLKILCCPHLETEMPVLFFEPLLGLAPAYFSQHLYKPFLT